MRLMDRITLWLISAMASTSPHLGSFEFILPPAASSLPLRMSEVSPSPLSSLYQKVMPSGADSINPLEVVDTSSSVLALFPLTSLFFLECSPRSPHCTLLLICNGSRRPSLTKERFRESRNPASAASDDSSKARTESGTIDNQVLSIK